MKHGYTRSHVPTSQFPAKTAGRISIFKAKPRRRHVPSFLLDTAIVSSSRDRRASSSTWSSLETPSWTIFQMRKVYSRATCNSSGFRRDDHCRVKRSRLVSFSQRTTFYQLARHTKGSHQINHSKTFCFDLKRKLRMVGYKSSPARCFILGAAPRAKDALHFRPHDSEQDDDTAADLFMVAVTQSSSFGCYATGLAGTPPVAEGVCLFGMR